MCYILYTALFLYNSNVPSKEKKVALVPWEIFAVINMYGFFNVFLNVL